MHVKNSPLSQNSIYINIPPVKKHRNPKSLSLINVDNCSFRQRLLMVCSLMSLFIFAPAIVYGYGFLNEGFQEKNNLKIISGASLISLGSSVVVASSVALCCLKINTRNQIA